MPIFFIPDKPGQNYQTSQTEFKSGFQCASSLIFSMVTGVFAVCVVVFDYSTLVCCLFLQRFPHPPTLKHFIHDLPDSAALTVPVRHIRCPAGSYPSCDAVAQLPFHIKDQALFAPVFLPLCQNSLAKLIEITITDPHGSYSLTVCRYAFTQTSIMPIHTCNWEQLLAEPIRIFTVHDIDKTRCDSGGGE